MAALALGVAACASDSPPRQGRVTLMPALEIELRTDTATFDQTYPEGADYVMVPAMHVDDDPAILDRIRSQASKGAIIVGVCSGARSRQGGPARWAQVHRPLVRPQ